jgi:hypothetical protein
MDKTGSTTQIATHQPKSHVGAVGVQGRRGGRVLGGKGKIAARFPGVGPARANSACLAESRVGLAPYRQCHQMLSRAAPPHCNWSSTCACHGARLGLSGMRVVMKRVQEKHPIVDFG